MMELKIDVNPSNANRPIELTGKCRPINGQIHFVHAVEHCVISPKLSIPISDEFVSLYCTSYATLHDHFTKLKQSHQYYIPIIIFYSLIEMQSL